MTDWQTIDTAPTDGTPVKTGRIGHLASWGQPTYPITSRFIDGRWTAEFRKGEWCSYDPQPTHWKPLKA